MKSLYAVFINGTMLYVQGELSEQECVAIEAFAKHFQFANKSSSDCEAICQDFIKAVETSFHILLVQTPLRFN